MDFARRNPAIYRLMFSPNPIGRPASRRRIFDLPVATLTRVAAHGAMRIEPTVAAQIVLSGNVGVALNQITQPELYADPELSVRMREAVFGSFLVEPEPRVGGRTDGPTDPDPIAPAAIRLGALLEGGGTELLIEEEKALLRRWLSRLAGPSAPAGESHAPPRVPSRI